MRGEHRVDGYGAEGMHNYNACIANLENLVTFLTVKGSSRVPSVMELMSCDVLEYSLSLSTNLFVVEHVPRICCGVDQDIAGVPRTEMQSHASGGRLVEQSSSSTCW